VAEAVFAQISPAPPIDSSHPFLPSIIRFLLAPHAVTGAFGIALTVIVAIGLAVPISS
jgi:hypothetical protein